RAAVAARECLFGAAKAAAIRKCLVGAAEGGNNVGLNSDQIDDLERNVTKEEIKRAVWDCGTDKSPCPDGFTFGFYRRYWDIKEKDVVDAVSYFFTEGTFPKGCNASFIALIPKMQDAKVVKGYRPISLIGSLYKIIAKILANRLVVVLIDLVSEVQYAFIANRQIIDGPFILNELIQWCKSKKKQTMIFKIDFEEAYDSVKWDYLDDVLNKFSFGTKWKGWIHNCLHSSKGSILVNESPTGEFHFRRGLKQGDPLSSFLFILVKENLHLSFQNVVNEGLFKGKKMSWVKWSRVLASKDKGGLGVSSFFALNRALLLKWVWRFRNDMISLWTRIKKLVTGSTRFFWEDVWMGDVTFKSRFPRVYALESDKKITVAAKMNHNVLGFSLRRAPRDGVEMEQLKDLIAILEDVELPIMHDRWIWSLVGSGEFSVASARRFIDDHRLTSSPHKTRWVKVVLVKINVMAWKVRFDFLPTRLNLSRRGLELQSISFPNCNKDVKSTSHIFFACSIVRDLYRKIASWWELSYSKFDSYDDWLEWFQALRMHSNHRDLLEGVYYAMWWLVWNFRNKSLFKRFSWVEWLKNPNLISL
nr:RNA-directed DNA polymerase, eukaryota [Tanacetum cinerariifolium]